ncbi:hypothetical protein CELL_03203 [Cellulomonas sp. T2.31MG-18]
MRVLHHEFWIDAQANVRFPDELSTPHLQAILGMLSARSTELYRAELLDTFIRTITAWEEGSVDGEELAHELGMTTIVDVTPAEWLETTALVRAIRRTLRVRAEA